MKITRMFLPVAAISALAVVLAAAGCSGDNDPGPVVAPLPPPPAAPAEVPGSAGVTVAAFITYLTGLGGSDETTEPLVLPGTFAVPVDETSEPQTLI